MLYPDTALSIGGRIDTAHARYCDHIYLIDEAGVVLGARAALPHPARGENLFDCFAVPTGERVLLKKHLSRYGDELYLLASPKTPLLVLPAPFAGTRTLLVSVPDAALLPKVRGIGAYAELFAGFLVSSPTLSAEKHVKSEENFAAIQEWIFPCRDAFLPKAPRDADVFLARTVLCARATRLAALLGCNLAYDASGIGYASVQNATYSLLEGCLAALFLFARRAAADRSLALFVERGELASPTLHAVLTLADENDPLTELLPAKQSADSKGLHLDAYFSTVREKELHVSFTYCTPPLEQQELRTNHGYKGFFRH